LAAATKQIISIMTKDGNLLIVKNIVKYTNNTIYIQFTIWQIDIFLIIKRSEIDN